MQMFEIKKNAVLCVCGMIQFIIIDLKRLIFLIRIVKEIHIKSFDLKSKPDLKR